MYSVYPAPFLGPCRCQGCGATVWWAKRMSRLGNLNTYRTGWRNDDGLLHRCQLGDLDFSTGRHQR